MKRVLFAALVYCLASPTFGARFVTEVVALSGDPAPDGNGEFMWFNRFPVVNHAGSVAFASFLASNENTGVFRRDRETLIQIVREGQATPDGNGEFNNLVFSGFDRYITMNSSGQVGFSGRVASNNESPSDYRGVFHGDGGIVTQIARERSIAPDGNGEFRFFHSHALNSLGQSAFVARLRNTSDGSADDRAIFRGGGAEITQIVREGHTLTLENGDRLGVNSFSTDQLSLNDAGQVVFRASVFETPGRLDANGGIFLSDGQTTSQVAHEGQSVSDGILSSFGDPVLNDVGDVALVAVVAPQLGDVFAHSRLFVSDGGSLTEIARQGEETPNGMASFSHFWQPTLNNVGQVAFIANLAEAVGTAVDKRAIFRGDSGALTQVATTGQASNSANGIFSDFDNPAVNDIGQVAFRASLTDSTSETTDFGAIFLHDDRLGLLTIAQEGDAFLGSTLDVLTFNTALILPGEDVINPPLVNDRSGFNNLGQVAYHFTLADGRQGIAIATLVPEPSSFALLLVLGFFGGRFRTER